MYGSNEKSYGILHPISEIQDVATTKIQVVVQQEGGVRVCGDGVLRYFWRGFGVILILTCGIAVSKH